MSNKLQNKPDPKNNDNWDIRNRNLNQFVGLRLWNPEQDEDDYFEPNDYEEGDIGSATVAEIRKQNGEL